jgi:hypothetical protein
MRELPAVVMPSEGGQHNNHRTILKQQVRAVTTGSFAFADDDRGGILYLCCVMVSTSASRPFLTSASARNRAGRTSCGLSIGPSP